MTMRLFSCNLPIVTGSSTGLEKKSDMMDFLVDEMKSLQSTQPGASIDRLGPDCLGVGEFAQAEMRQLPAIAAFLDAAHRNTRVRCRKTVDNTPPVSRRRAMRWARATSLVHRLPPKP